MVIFHSYVSLPEGIVFAIAAIMYDNLDPFLLGLLHIFVFFWQQYVEQM
jgi:hypothetical protein